jgi:hypothetical protein
VGVASPEKAGVGGSTPSLATNILKSLPTSRLVLPVRFQSALVIRSRVGCCSYLIAKNLAQPVWFLSPLSIRFCPRAWLTSHGALPLSRHAVIANGVGLKLECELGVAVAEQSLHGFRIGFDANEERCEALAQIMEAKSPRVIVH